MIHFKEGDGNPGADLNMLSDSKNGQNAKVLILENEAIIAEDIRRRLEEMGYNVTAVTNSGRAAIDLAKQNPPDILVMDLDVKGDLNGAEAAVILQGYFEKPVPVVFVTAFSEREFPVIKALDMYLYVKKPFSDEDLIQSIHKAISLGKSSDG